MNKMIRIGLFALLANAATSFAATVNNQVKLNVSFNHMLALWCDRVGGQCMAVGQEDNSDNPNLLVYQSQDAGLTWGEALPLSKVPNSNNLNINSATDIHCNETAQRCVIMSSTKMGEDIVPIIYTLDGVGHWSQPAVLPLPKSNIPKEDRILYAKLSCGESAFSCVIAATMVSDVEATPFFYTTRDAGHKWATTPLTSLEEPSNTYSNGIAVYGVHCDGSGFFCKAVGYALTRDSFWTGYYTSKPVVYTSQDGGVHWGAPVVLPSDIDELKKASTLTDVKCDETGMQCVAVGLTQKSETGEMRFYSFTSTNGGVTWDNKQWINSNYSDKYLNAFDCDNSMASCVAVGYARNNFNNQKGLIYTTKTSAQTWEQNTSQAFPVHSYLTDVFCSKTDDQCLIVGVREAMDSLIRIPSKKELIAKIAFRNFV